MLYLSNSHQVPQKFKVGRAVWFKSPSNGAYRMKVTEAFQDPGTMKWEYRLKDTNGIVQEGWYVETTLTAANPSK